MVKRQEIIAIAESWIGTPYRHQASVKAVGCDCLGLIRGIWRELYGSEPEIVPAYSPGWAEEGGGEALAEAGFRHLTPIELDEILPGDVLLFRWRENLPAKHAAIANGDYIIHAQDGAKTCAVDFNEFWKSRLAFAFRFPNIED